MITLLSLIEKYDITASCEQDYYPEFPEMFPAGTTHWTVTLCFGRRRLTTEYHVGPWHQYVPTAEEVLSGLMLDASCAMDNDSFEEWCVMFGYSPALKTSRELYKGCVATERKVRKFLGDHVVEFFQSQY